MDDLIINLTIITIGLILGSFINVLSYRIPKGLLLDPNGVIIAKDTELRGNRLGEKLNEIFN